VYDSNDPLVLHIKKTDCVGGQKDPQRCAAAKAACREPGVIEARVYRTRTFLLFQNGRGKKFWKRFQTPQSLRGEMIAFDRGGSFQPDDYKLGVITPSQKLGTVRVNHKSGRPPHKKKITPHIVQGIRPPSPYRGVPYSVAPKKKKRA
jgi:hypothetical protein